MSTINDTLKCKSLWARFRLAPHPHRCLGRCPNLDAVSDTASSMDLNNNNHKFTDIRYFLSTGNITSDCEKAISFSTLVSVILLDIVTVVSNLIALILGFIIIKCIISKAVSILTSNVRKSSEESGIQSLEGSNSVYAPGQFSNQFNAPELCVGLHFQKQPVN